MFFGCFGLSRRPRLFVDKIIQINGMGWQMLMALPQAIDHFVAGERHQPGHSTRALGVEAFRSAPHSRIDLLKHFFCLAMVGEHAKAHSKKLGSGAAIQFSKGALVASGNLRKHLRKLVSFVSEMAHGCALARWLGLAR